MSSATVTVSYHASEQLVELRRYQVYRLNRVHKTSLLGRLRRSLRGHFGR
jgi:hypothetical protein